MVQRLLHKKAKTANQEKLASTKSASPIYRKLLEPHKNILENIVLYRETITVSFQPKCDILSE